MSNTLYIDTIQVRNGSAGVIIADSYDTAVIFDEAYSGFETPQETFQHTVELVKDVDTYTVDKVEELIAFAVDNDQAIMVDGAYLTDAEIIEAYNG